MNDILMKLPEPTAQEVVEWLEEEHERGECCLDTLHKVITKIGESHKDLYKKFNDNYIDFYNRDIEELDEDLFNEVIKVLKEL